MSTPPLLNQKLIFIATRKNPDTRQQSCNLIIISLSLSLSLSLFLFLFLFLFLSLFLFHFLFLFLALSLSLSLLDRLTIYSVYFNVLLCYFNKLYLLAIERIFFCEDADEVKNVDDSLISPPKNILSNCPRKYWKCPWAAYTLWFWSTGLHVSYIVLVVSYTYVSDCNTIFIQKNQFY